MRVFLSGAVLVFAVAAVFLFSSGMKKVGCQLSGSDLKREVEYNWVSGKCVVVTEEGKRVYLEHLRTTD